MGTCNNLSQKLWSVEVGLLFFPNFDLIENRILLSSHLHWFFRVIKSFSVCHCFLVTPPAVQCRPVATNLKSSDMWKKFSFELVVRWKIAFTCLATCTGFFRDWINRLFVLNNWLCKLYGVQCRPATTYLLSAAVWKHFFPELVVRWKIAFPCLDTCTDLFALHSFVSCPL